MNRIESKDYKLGNQQDFFVLLWWQNLYSKQGIWWISSWLLELIMRIVSCQTKNLISIFGLIRAAFFWNDKSIIFSLVKKAFLFLFLFKNKMVDSETLIISIGALIKDPEMLRFIPDHIKTKKMCKHAIKKLPFLIKYVTNQYKTQQMCDKAILENGGMLMFIPDFYKDQNIYNKAVDNSAHALGSVPDRYITQKMWDKAVNTYSFTIQFVLDWLNTQEMCDKAVDACLFVLDFISDWYMTQ